VGIDRYYLHNIGLTRAGGASRFGCERMLAAPHNQRINGLSSDGGPQPSVKKQSECRVSCDWPFTSFSSLPARYTVVDVISPLLHDSAAVVVEGHAVIGFLHVAGF